MGMGRYTAKFLLLGRRKPEPVLKPCIFGAQELENLRDDRVLSDLHEDIAGRP